MTEKTICLFHCVTVTKDAYNSEIVKLAAVTSGYEELPEDKHFSKYTPSGSLDLQVSNPNVQGFFVPGDRYYIEITPRKKES
ncbi:MAG TPA: hypothetical protein VFW40_11535 [Capsulimonadaceae bacterium]|nr:hypothetical protein [Capsulimonadaceae bacterium]